MPIGDMEQQFQIEPASNVTRQSLEDAGYYNTHELTDDEMKDLAAAMRKYAEEHFWDYQEVFIESDCLIRTKDVEKGDC